MEVMLQLNDVDVQMEADSGVDLNLMDKHQFKAFIQGTKEKPILEPRRIKLRTLQHKFEEKGEFQVMISNGDLWKTNQIYCWQYLEEDSQLRWLAKALW